MRKLIQLLLKAEWKSPDMSYYEGILVTTNHRPNAAAIGAEIEGDRIGSQIYLPSDTARRLDEDVRFTYSLTSDPRLFYKAALTGHDEPEKPELEPQNLKAEDDDFIYPSGATKTYFCEVKRTKIITEKDDYGKANIKLIEAEVIKKKGTDEYIGRENPLVDAMVYASRMFVADEEQKEWIREKVKSVLEDTDSKLKGKILDFVER